MRVPWCVFVRRSRLVFANATARTGFRLSPKCSPLRYGLAFPRGTSLSRFRMIKDVHPQAELGKEISSSEVHTGHTVRTGDGRPFLSDGKVGWGGWTRTNTVLINSEVSYQLDHAPAVPRL